MEAQEERISNTPWQIRCSSEQKRFFQKFVETTGMNAAEAVMKAFESFRVQIEDDNHESKKVLLEADSLISRLQTMLRSQFATAIEKQRQCDEERKALGQEKEKYQSFYDDALTQLESKFTLEKENLEKKFQNEIKTKVQNWEEEIKQKDDVYLSLKEKFEKLESELLFEKREKQNLQKQYQESLRLYEMADERLLELREKTKNMEEKINKYDAILERNKELEKEILVLQLKYESLAREENIKREYLEKEFRREFRNEQEDLAHS